MMRDEIFYGNLLGLLKTGRWNLNAGEAIALIQIKQEVERRLSPPAPIPVEPPIKELKKKKGRADGNK